MSSILTRALSLPLSSKASSTLLLHALAAGLQVTSFVASIINYNTSPSVSASKTSSCVNSPSRTVISNGQASLSLILTLILTLAFGSILVAILSVKGFFSGGDRNSEDPPDPESNDGIDLDPFNPISDPARIDAAGQPPPPPPPPATSSSDARKRCFNWLIWLMLFFILFSAALWCFQEDIKKFVRARLVKGALYRWLGTWGQYSLVRWIVDKCLSFDLELRHVPLWIHIPAVAVVVYFILFSYFLYALVLLKLTRRGLRTIGLPVNRLLRWAIPILCFYSFIYFHCWSPEIHDITLILLSYIMPLWELGPFFTDLACLHVLHPLVATACTFLSSSFSLLTSLSPQATVVFPISVFLYRSSVCCLLLLPTRV